MFLEGDLVTSGSGTSSWNSSGAGIFTNTQADMYLHLLGSSNQSVGSFSDEDIGIAPYKTGGTATANGYISCFDMWIGNSAGSGNSGTFAVDDETVHVTKLYGYAGTFN